MAKKNDEKVLELNLDPLPYGTFAEIGAGQETANFFFRASGTAGTVAKSISAYDMTMSDAIYGSAQRYVSLNRLQAMLDHEYHILLERLATERGDRTTFFTFCNTVRARAWNDTGECHGWLGIRFQSKPNTDYSEIIMHIRLLDKENIDQADALGILGVNLIHSAFYQREDLKTFVESLVDNLHLNQIEIDYLKFSGQGYQDFDNRLCALQLIQSKLTPATMFLPNGEIVQPAEALYHKPVLLLKGSFNPVLNMHLEMLRMASKSFKPLLHPDMVDKTVEICEISMDNLLRDQTLDLGDFIDRSNTLQQLGKIVLLSNCPEFYKISAFIHRCTDQPIGMILSIGILNELFKSKWTENLAGGTLESFGRLFKDRVTLQVFPWKNRKNDEIVTADNFRTPSNYKHLYQYFLDNQKIMGVPIEGEPMLNITGREVCNMIIKGDENWRNLVPECSWETAKYHALQRARTIKK